jgi:hypothetical protein
MVFGLFYFKIQKCINQFYKMGHIAYFECINFGTLFALICYNKGTEVFGV